jgi:hypothetical protein
LRSSDSKNREATMPKKLLATSSALLVGGVLLLAATVQAETVTIRWRQLDVARDKILGFRLYQRTASEGWTPPVEVLVSELAPSPEGIYQHDIELDPMSLYVFAATAFNETGESARSNERMIYPELPPEPVPGPGAQKLGSFDFDDGVGEPAGWLDTAPYNGLNESDSLFHMGMVDAQGVLMTTLPYTNIHSHVIPGDIDEWFDYEYSGRMRKSHANGGFGVTVYSQYPSSDTYYRIHSHSSSVAFQLENHGAGGISCNAANTGVTPVAGSWYAFRIRVETLASETVLSASVWPEGSAEPGSWQVECSDASPGRLTRGTVGVSAIGPGEKYWDELEIKLLEVPALPPPELPMPHLPSLLP